MIGYMSQQWLCSEDRITCLRKKRRVMIVTSLQGQRKSGFFKSFIFLLENSYFRDFCHSLVVKNLPSMAGVTASILGWGTKIPHATGCSQKKTQPVISLAIPHLFWQCYICALLETESFSSAKQIWTDWHVAIFSFIYFSMFLCFAAEILIGLIIGYCLLGVLCTIWYVRVLSFQNLANSELWSLSDPQGF